MKITRHPVDVTHIADTFRREVPHFDHLLSMVANRVDNLHIILSSGSVLGMTGSVVAPDAPEVGRALRLAARAGAGVFAFARPDHRPSSYVLEDRVSVSYSQTTDESLVNLMNWQKAFYLVTIARQTDAFAALAEVSYQLLMQSSTRSRSPSDRPYRFIEVLKALWTDPSGFSRVPVFTELEQFCTSGPKGTAPNPYVKRITAPLLRVMRQLERGDADGFARALTEAIKLHKEHWSSTDQLRKEFEGFVSLPLTAVAVLAWDRGLRFEVESDYLPRSWVTGEVFAPGGSL